MSSIQWDFNISQTSRTGFLEDMVLVTIHLIARIAMWFNVNVNVNISTALYPIFKPNLDIVEVK